ncbi:MAG: orotidine-5'-phosphate decarboxylase [Proteobacteria bacterium]|nr:orotidine-5'-phosphate decarboxylase [Pseudomonadota bacterium]MDA1058766.1 orotidine-5'-phosphate decarboxylase [Pseudomonadota bacterium]
MSNPIFCALDTNDLDRARKLGIAVSDHVGGLKVGKEFFTAHGPDGVRQIVPSGVPLFLDLKFHDIPNTVAGAVRAACVLHPAMINVHASGGTAMMESALAAAQESDSPPWVLGVTVLTSLDARDLESIGITGSPQDHVLRLAALAQHAGLAGVVCSAREISALRVACGPDFKLVVPGIRPEGSAVGDQKRTMTPAEALERGADVLVIGRPITAANDPAAAAQAIRLSLGSRAA